MNTALSADPDAQRRTLALDAAVSHCRRASSAAAAAACGEPDALRFAVLESALRQLSSVLRELKALA